MGVPISSLPAASALTGAELLPVVQSGQTKRTTTDAIPYVPAGTNAVTTTVQAKLREAVSVKDFGAVGDGSTDDAPAFTAAATYAASVDKDVMVPAPAVSYKLDSDPAVPANTNFFASPDWFSGTGKMPFHLFTELSEGVNPRVFSTKLTGYSETEPNETKRKWAVNGWVNYKNAPATGYEGTVTDAVGVDGRGVTSVANGRVWGLLGLAQLDPGVSGVAQAYGQEVDINNNNAHINSFDSLPTAKAQVIASGGNYRPETAGFVIATKTPTNGLGDNRFYAAWRFYQDCYKDFGIHFDNNCGGVAIRIPSTAIGVQMIKPGGGEFNIRMGDASNRGQMFAPAGTGIDVLKSDGSQLLGINEAFVNSNVPFTRKTSVISLPTSINAGTADIFVLTSSGTITGGITNASDGQRITISNFSGGAITLNRNANMRTAGGAAVTINNLCAVEFLYVTPTFIQLGSTTNA